MFHDGLHGSDLRTLAALEKLAKLAFNFWRARSRLDQNEMEQPSMAARCAERASGTSTNVVETQATFAIYMLPTSSFIPVKRFRKPTLCDYTLLIKVYSLMFFFVWLFEIPYIRLEHFGSRLEARDNSHIILFHHIANGVGAGKTRDNPRRLWIHGLQERRRCCITCFAQWLD